MFVIIAKPCERFLGFLECINGVSGEALASTILTQLNSWQLPASLLHGQGYDGAGAMSGCTKGVAARISTQYPKALYTHCAAYRLNLCVVKCCAIREVSNTMETADSITWFFSNSLKQQLELEKWIADVCSNEEKRHKLKEMCRTRWMERHEAFDVFVDLYLPLVSCLEEISRGSPSHWKRDTRHEAQSFLLALSQFSFIISLLLTQKILAYTKGISVKLQGRYVDVVKAHQDIESFKSALKRVRSTVDKFHDTVYDEVFCLSQLVGVQESSPRLVSRQQHRSSIPSGTVKEYYKLNLMIPLLDHIILELDSRFDSESSARVVEFMKLIPSSLHDNTSCIQASDIPRLLALYEDDLPAPRCLDVELELWQSMWARNAEEAEKALVDMDKDYYPNIRSLMIIMVTIPVTLCECERSINLLRLVKSRLRSTMGAE